MLMFYYCKEKEEMKAGKFNVRAKEISRHPPPRGLFKHAPLVKEQQ